LSKRAELALALRAMSGAGLNSIPRAQCPSGVIRPEQPAYRS